MAVAMGDTFLTESRTMDFPEPEAMARVREEHSRLQGVVFSLNKKISQVLAKQEGDFLAAYRAHMYTVQKELQTLRQRVIEAENVLQKNDKVQKLEDECDWYRKEALRLDSFNTAMKKDLKYMKGKLEILEDDRNWLARQLKACRKQDKVLRAELGLRAESQQQQQQQGREVTAALRAKCASDVESSQRQPASQASQPLLLSGVMGQATSQPLLLSGVMGTLDRVRRSEQSASSPELLPFGEAERLQLQTAPNRQRRGGGNLLCHDGSVLTKRVRTLERKLANEQKENLRVRSTRARDAVERVEMEDFFMRCIEDVKKHIQQRKMNARALHSRSAGPRQRPHGSATLRGNLSPGDTHGGAPSSILKTAPSKTTLEEFTASDRRAVVESLLQRDDVVAQLFDTFFPVASTGEQLQPGRQ